MRLEKCYVCGSNVYPGHGSLFVRNDARQFRFCRSKCRRSFNLKRNPRRIRWTKAFRKSHGKELAEDMTFEFERRRARVDKYDREAVGQTLQAMQRVEQVKQQRQRSFYKERMKVRKVVEKKQAERELGKNIALLEPQVALRREQVPRKAVKEGKKVVKLDEAMDESER